MATEIINYDREEANVGEENIKVRLLSSDGRIFDVEKKAAVQSEVLKKLIQDMGGLVAVESIPLFDVPSKVLEKVIEYWIYHVDHPPSGLETINDIDLWDVEFLNVDRRFLSQLAMAAHYLDIRTLSRLVCRKIAEIIQSFETPEKVRENLGIKNDLPPEVEEEIRRSNQWAFASPH